LTKSCIRKNPELKKQFSGRRMKKWLTIAWVLPLLMATSAQAEKRLYQWTDAAGRVHFSDTAPAQSVIDSSRALRTAPTLPLVTHYKPAQLPAGKRLPLAIALPDYAALKAQPALGTLYMAGDCINPTALQWGDLQGPGSIFMEGNRRYLAESMAGVLSAQGYDVEVAASDERWRELAASGALRLVPQVLAVVVKVCTPRHTSLQIRQNDIPRLIQVSGERAGTWMKIRWQLWRMGGKKPLTVFETDGAFMQWQSPTSLWNVMHEASRQATRNLSGYPALGLALRAPPSPAAKNSAGADNTPSGLLDSLMARFTLQPRVAQALVLMGPLKVMMVEHYQENDHWPTDINGIVPEGTELRQPGLVDEVALGPEGEIIVSLSGKVYPRGYLRLMPKNNGMSVSWDCRSNLPPAAFGGEDGYCRSVR